MVDVLLQYCSLTSFQGFRRGMQLLGERVSTDLNTYLSTSSTQVGRVFIGSHVPPPDVLLLLDLPDSIADKLLVVFAPFDPVKSDAAVELTMDVFNWKSL